MKLCQLAFITFFILSNLCVCSYVADSQQLSYCPDSCSSKGPELIINGTFDQFVPNSVYATTAPFVIATLASTPLLGAGEYYITTDANQNNSIWSGADHTTGFGSFLVCDGYSGSQTSAWGQVVNISSYPPNTDFVFCAWVNNNVVTTSNFGNPFLELHVNGVSLLPTAVSLPEVPDAWILISAPWNSGPVPPSTVTLEIVSTAIIPLGNDFGIDDISFRACGPALPVSIVGSPNQTICIGDSVQLITISSTVNINWTPAAGLSATNISSPYASPIITTTYVVTAGIASACSQTDTVVVFVIPSFSDATFTYNIPSCNTTVSFQSLSTPGISYFWDFGDGNTSTALNPSNTYLNGGTFTVTLIASDACRNDTASINIIIPDIYIQPSFTSIQDSCTNEVTFVNTTTNATNYQWDFGDGFTDSTFSPVHNYATSGTFTVTLIVANACSTATISNSALAEPLTPSTPAFKMYLDSCSRTATFQNTSINSYEQLWNFGDGNYAHESIATHEYLEPGLYPLTLIINETTGCRNQIDSVIPIEEIFDKLYIPNAFTPNADGKNDLFEIITAMPCETGTLSIFNRWGNLVFETDDLYKPWNGISEDTEACEGIYVYFVKLKSTTMKGYLHLVR